MRPPAALTSSRHSSNAIKSCLPLGATAPVRDMLNPILIGFVCASAEVAIASQRVTPSSAMAKAWRLLRMVDRPNIASSRFWFLPAYVKHPSLIRLFEIAQVRRRLIFLGRHQLAIRAQVVALRADADMGVV